jgi:RNA recognition motif. (a.k.a. RRM, RBD, or RNP domain)
MPSKLYVGNLAYSVSNEDLQELFSQVGQVQSTTVITGKFSGQSKGFGFVEVINRDRIAVLHASRMLFTRQEYAWINAKENVPAKRNNSKKSGVASSAQLNAKNGPSKAVKMRTSREWFQDRNPVRLSTCPESSIDPPAALGRMHHFSGRGGCIGRQHVFAPELRFIFVRPSMA